MHKNERGLAGLILALVLWIPSLWLNGVVFRELWAMFVVETFHVAPLGLEQALGLGLLTGFATSQMVVNKYDDDQDPSIIRAAWNILNPVVVYSTALIIRWVF